MSKKCLLSWDPKFDSDEPIYFIRLEQMTCYWYDLRSKASYEGFGQTRCSCSTVHTLISYLIDRWQHNPDSHDKIYRGTKNHMWRWQYLLDVSQTKKQSIGEKKIKIIIFRAFHYISIFLSSTWIAEGIVVGKNHIRQAGDRASRFCFWSSVRKWY